jgi:aryl-alcohol dehydrogenase-like predicted oxidoreductase/RimJ/RimL family protein N-acetyltransferase
MIKLDSIESDRLHLEPISLKFLTKKYLDWLNDKEVNKYLESGGNYEFDSLKTYILNHQNNKTLFWAISIKSSKQHIGNIKIDPVDINNKSAELGIMIGDKNEWGKGYAFEAINAVEDYCLHSLKINTITLGLKRSNKNAFNLYRKLGYQEYNKNRHPKIYSNLKPTTVRMYKNICNKKLILGTVQLGKDYGVNNTTGQPNFLQSQKILTTAYDNNIRFLDTAESYGKSHQVIRDFHKKNTDKRFKVFSKLNSKVKIKKNQLEEHVLKTTNELYIDSIYGYMFHDYIFFKKNNFLINELSLIKSKNLIKKTGISLYNFSEIIDVIENYNFDFIQIPFNIFSDSKKFDKIFQKSSDNGVKIFARSIFLQGLIFIPKSNFPEKLSPLKKNVIQLKSYCEKHKIEINELALSYVMKNKFIDGVILGVDNLSQLKNNIEISNTTHNVKKTLVNKINIKDETLLNPSKW